MVKNSNKKLANGLIVGAGIGYAIAYPFHQSFTGGLLSSGLSAALVGGLADAFAVTGLFRVPMKWNFLKRFYPAIRTEVIPRNREKLISTLVDMVQEDLLSKENLKRYLKKMEFDLLLLKYLNEQGGRENAKEILRTITNDLLRKVKSEDIAQFVEEIIKNNLYRVKLSPFIAVILDYSLKNGYDEHVIKFILEEARRLVNHKNMQTILENAINKIIASYENGNKGRRFVNTLLDIFADISSETVALQIQSYLNRFLKDLQVPNCSIRMQLKVHINNWVNRFRTDTRLQEQIDVWKNHKVSQIELKTTIYELVEGFKQAAATIQTTTYSSNFWQKKLSAEVDKYIDQFEVNQNQRSIFDQFIKQKIFQLIDNYHQYLGTLVQTKLGSYTNEMLVEFIENKAGNDLQMIRVNGTLVGFLVGIVFNLLTYGFLH